MRKKILDFSMDNLPTAEQLDSEVKQVRYHKDFMKVLKNTVSSLIVVASVAVLVAMLLLPVLRVTGSSMLMKNHFVYVI